MPGSSLTKVTGFIAGRPEASLRRSTVQTWLVHNAVRNLQLTRITGERRNHTLIQEFLSIPAAGVSACAQAAQLQPATPFYNLRVDLLGASDTARNLGGRPRKVQPAAAPQPAVAVVQTPLSPSAQGGAGVPPWPQPSAPNVQDGLFGGLPAAEMEQRDPTDGSQRPTPATQAQQRTAGADGPSVPLLEQIAEQTAFSTGADVRQRCRQYGPDTTQPGPDTTQPQPVAQSIDQSISVSQNRRIYPQGQDGWPGAGVSALASPSKFSTRNFLLKLF